MKKLTLFIMACCIGVMSYAAGGSITYDLNGGVTNSDGWKNKEDMYQGLYASWNTFKGGGQAAWTSLAQLIADNGNAAAAVPKGIPTQAGTLDLTFIADATVKAKWQWLVDYMDAVCTEQSVGLATPLTLPSSNAAFLRYNLSAFFFNSVRSGWPISANYAIAGNPEAFFPAWKHGFAGPATYDGTAEIVIPEPFKEGYIFGGWYGKADFSGSKVTAIAVGAEGDTTLYARWFDYLPCANVWEKPAGETVKAGGVVTYIDATTVYIQDASAGLLVEFTEAPAVAVGELITFTGTTALIGDYAKVIDAAFLTKEASTLPSSQTITLSTLTTNVKPYMFELVNMEGLKLTSYESDGSATLVDDLNNTIKLAIVLNQTDFPVNTRINIKALVAYDTEVLLLGNVSDVTKAPSAGKDAFTYPIRENGKYSLENKWLISTNMDNLSANYIGKAAGDVRGMVADNGKMYFANRADLNDLQFTVIDGQSGERLAPVKLASDVFKYEGAEGATQVGYPLNDVKKDNAGNILVANLATSGASVFQVWKIDLATGAGTLILHDVLNSHTDFAEATARFDAFGVYGNVDDEAIIMVSNASVMEAYKWTISNGQASDPEVIIFDTETEGTYLTGLTNPGTAPQIFPLDEDYFYLDGNATFPTLIDMDGNVVDGFYANTGALKDTVTNTTVENGWSMNEGHNGLIEFEVGGEHFFLIAASNTAVTPPSTFRLFKWANANKEFKDIECLWTFPANGMGATSNSYRTAVPSVEVDEENGIANLYLYTGENGYGLYEFKVTKGSDVKIVKNNDAVKVSVVGKTLNLTQEVSSVAVYSTTGQLVAKAENVSTIDVTSNGIFLVKAITYDGQQAVQKVIVK